MNWMHLLRLVHHLRIRPIVVNVFPIHFDTLLDWQELRQNQTGHLEHNPIKFHNEIVFFLGFLLFPFLSFVGSDYFFPLIYSWNCAKIIGRSVILLTLTTTYKKSVTRGMDNPSSVRNVTCLQPGHKPITGKTRCPINLPPSSQAAIRMLANSGSTTFLNTNGSSSKIGFNALSRTHRVRNFFRTVSAGNPNMSTSTQTPTFLSLKNWPDKTVIDTVPAIIPSTYLCPCVCL